jgi:hypothetical protein
MSRHQRRDVDAAASESDCGGSLVRRLRVQVADALKTDYQRVGPVLMADVRCRHPLNDPPQGRLTPHGGLWSANVQVNLQGVRSFVQ